MEREGIGNGRSSHWRRRKIDVPTFRTRMCPRGRFAKQKVSYPRLINLNATINANPRGRRSEREDELLERSLKARFT